MLETRRPPNPIFRLGRAPDPWQPPDWSRASPDGTFGNRFDDPQGFYRVLYAASTRVSCFAETLARFRPDLSLLAELNTIEGENDFLALGTVPRDWLHDRRMGAAAAEGSYADIYASEWIALLRRNLARELLHLGITDLDASLLQSASPRRVTQLASWEAYKLDYAGIYYRSRYGHNLENWALFEPFQITPTESSRIDARDPDLSEALRILGLQLV